MNLITVTLIFKMKRYALILSLFFSTKMYCKFIIPECFPNYQADARPPLPPIPSSANGHMSKNISNAMAQPSQSTNIVPVMGTMNIESVDVGYKYQGNSPISSPYSSPKPPYARNDIDSSPGSLSSRAESYSSKDGRLNGTSNGSVSPNSRSPAPSKWDSPVPKKATLPPTNNTSNGDSTNFQSLDSLMADLGNMVTKDQSKSSQRDDMVGVNSEATAYSVFSTFTQY
jgi:hypothetical protein